MLNYIRNLNPVFLAFLATIFTYCFTIMGSSVVFLVKKTNKFIMDTSLALSGGLMLSASFFSLLIPAMEISDKLNQKTWLVLTIGFMFGGILLFFTDKFSHKILEKNKNITGSKRIFMMLFSITIHNIPEGLVVGLAFGSLKFGSVSLMSASMLALGIAIQNFPEGSALSLPMLRDGMNKKKAFFLGQVSGIVEPISGVIGAILASKIETILPIMLPFAAGAMVYVVVEEIIPESQDSEKKDLMAFFTMIGFAFMMLLELLLD